MVEIISLLKYRSGSKTFFTILISSCCFLSYAQKVRTYYDDNTVAEAREKVNKYDWAQSKKQALEKRVLWILEMSDQELWDFVPPVTQRRALNVAFNVECPKHGTEALRKGGTYPWIMSRENPFKVKCPVGGEIYPTNDFIPWHHGGKEGEIDTSEEYVDDGTGYIGPDGQVYHFVAHYIFWQRWRKGINPALGDLRDLYLLTDDKRYARAAAILLARIATDYPQSDYASQAVHRQEPPHGIRGGIMDYIAENALISQAALAFDAITPALDDPEVIDFIRVQGINDISRHIEENLLFEMVNRITGGRNDEHENLIWGNFGMYQRSMALLAVVLNNDDPNRGLTSTGMVDWILRPGPWDKVGAIDEALWNRFYRDGFGGEASPTYSSGWAAAIMTIAQILNKLDYDLYNHPKIKRVVDVWLDMAVLGKWTSSIGDAGDIFGLNRTGWTRTILLPAYKKIGDPRWAKAMEMVDIKDDQLWETIPLDRIQLDAAEFGEWPTGGTRLLGGYGLAIAESYSAPVGLALHYGYAGGGHGHRDRLNIEMFAMDRPVLPQNGYPTPLGSIQQAPKRFYWTSNTISKYGVTINRKGQKTFNRGYLELLASTPGLQAIDASAEQATYPEEASMYRRTSLLIENSSGLPYLFDIFRVNGGWEHVWSFHGPPFEEFETFGLDLGPKQEKGTLAGTDISFGEKPKDPNTDITSGFQYLFNVQKAAPPASVWGATWSQPEDSSFLRMTALPTAVTEVVLADSEPELKENHPETIPYLLAFNSSDTLNGPNPTRSDFVAIVEPYKKAATLKNMRRLYTEGAEHAVAASIKRPNGEDLVISHISPDDRSVVHFAGAEDQLLILEGEIAHLNLEKGEMSGISLINGQKLTSPWIQVETTRKLQGKITKADYQRNFIVLDRLIEGAEALVGQTVVTGNDLHSTAFQIKGVEVVNGAMALFFGDMPMVVSKGMVSEIGENSITTSTEFTHWQVDGSKHAGRHLVDHQKKKSFFIEKFNGDKFQLKENHPQFSNYFSKEDDSGDRNQFWIAETGVGDDWKIPSIVYLKKQLKDDSLAFELNLNVPVRVHLSTQASIGENWLFLNANEGWQTLKVSRSDNFIEFQISPASVRDGKTLIKAAGFHPKIQN
jgi:hypothetical protein